MRYARTLTDKVIFCDTCFYLKYLCPFLRCPNEVKEWFDYWKIGGSAPSNPAFNQILKGLIIISLSFKFNHYWLYAQHLRKFGKFYISSL